MENQAVFDWANVAGPVAHRYETCRDPFSLIIGPTGGGKTQSSARKCLRVALWQHPSPRGGIRKARIICVAPTYPLLWDAPIPSFKKVFPEILGGKFTGTPGRPADYAIDLPMEVGGVKTPIHLEVAFRSIADKDLEEFVRGVETTAWWLPEMDQAPEGLISLLQNRTGRYPEPEDRPEPTPGMPPAYAGVFGDANAPVVGGWFHKRVYVDARARKETVLASGQKIIDRVFFQPPGVLEDGTENPHAENLHNLRKIRENYYGNLAANMEDYDIGRLLKCKPGYSRNGRPVHEHFDPLRHVALGEIPVDPSLPVLIGMDAGNTLKGAATFNQVSWSGQKRALAEISPLDRQIDLTELCAEVRRMMDTRFRGCREAKIVVDPSARAASTQNKNITYAQLIQAATGIPVELAPSNDPGIRRTALDQRLKRSAGPGEAAYIIDPKHCPRLVEALSGGYRFRKIGDAYSPTPDKNDHSHEAEADQYACLGNDGLGVLGGGLISPPGGGGDGDDRVIQPC